MHQVQLPNTNYKFLFQHISLKKKKYWTRPYLSYKGTFFHLRLYQIDLVVCMYIAKIKRVNPEKLAQLTFLDKSQFFLYPLYKKRLRACWVLLAVVNLIEVNSPYTTGNRKSFPNFRLHKKLFLAYYLLQVCIHLPSQSKKVQIKYRCVYKNGEHC